MPCLFSWCKDDGAPAPCPPAFPPCPINSGTKYANATLDCSLLRCTMGAGTYHGEVWSWKDPVVLDNMLKESEDAPEIECIEGDSHMFKPAHDNRSP